MGLSGDQLIAVGVFLFFSGFGLLKSYKTRGGVFGNRILKYIFRLLVSYFLVFAIKLLIDICSKCVDYSIMKSLLTLQMPPSQLWYLKAQLICYILFAAAGSLCKDDYNNMAVVVSLPIFLWIMISLVLGRENINMAWYNTMPLFPIGMFVASKEECISRIIRKRPIATILVLTGVTIMLSGISFFVAKDLIYLFVSIYSVLIYGIVSQFLAVRSVVWEFIGKHSLSIYLWHLLLLNLLQRYRFNISDERNVCFLLFGTIALSVLTDSIIGFLFKTAVIKKKE